MARMAYSTGEQGNNEKKMNNTVNKTQLITAGFAVIALAGVAALAAPVAVEVFASVAIIGALFGLGAIEMKKRAY